MKSKTYNCGGNMDQENNDKYELIKEKMTDFRLAEIKAKFEHAHSIASDIIETYALIESSRKRCADNYLKMKEILDSAVKNVDLPIDNVESNLADDLATKWTKSTEGGKDYYYYKTKLAKNESTSSLIKSVTFNPNVTISTQENCVENATTHTKTCTTTATGYAGGTYTLTVKVETVQFDQYKDVWSTNIAIS